MVILRAREISWSSVISILQSLYEKFKFAAHSGIYILVLVLRWKQDQDLCLKWLFCFQRSDSWSEVSDTTMHHWKRAGSGWIRPIYYLGCENALVVSGCTISFHPIRILCTIRVLHIHQQFRKGEVCKGLAWARPVSASHSGMWGHTLLHVGLLCPHAWWDANTLLHYWQRSMVA